MAQLDALAGRSSLADVQDQLARTLATLVQRPQLGLPQPPMLTGSAAPPLPPSPPSASGAPGLNTLVPSATGTSGSYSGAYSPGTPNTEGFAKQLLLKIGAPVTHNTMAAMMGWMHGEGTTASWNPMATTDSAPGSSQFNSVGVQNFPNMQTGVDTTYRTLTNGYYGNILGLLRSNASPIAIAQAVATSPWGTHDAVSATQAVLQGGYHYNAGSRRTSPRGSRTKR